MIYLEEIEKKALADNIPIMQKDGLEFLIRLINENQAQKVLEIGSAVGYSAAMIVLNSSAQVETLEIDPVRYQEACANIATLKLEDKITIHLHDALDFELDQLEHRQFDCLFIDAAKAQYQKFFEKYMPVVKPGGFCVVDNLDFHGMVFAIDDIKNRNTRQLVKKIKRFKDWILNHEQYEVEYYHIGDGICVIRRK